MFKSSTISGPVAVAGLTLMLALGGCSSGGDAPATDGTGMTPMAVDTSGIHGDAMVEAGMFTIAAGGSTTRGDVTYSCPAGGEACMVVVKADGMTTSTGGTATAMNSATLQAKLDAEAELAAKKKAEMEAQEKAKMEAKKAAAKDAMALFNGFGDAGDDDTADLVLGSITVTDKHGGSATVMADGAGGTPAVKATDTMVSMLGKWKGTELAGDTDGEMPSNTVVVYTDIEAPKPVPFSEIHELTGDVLSIDADADADAHVKLISAPAFTHSGRMNHDPDPSKADDVARIRGMFNGASGEYRCTAATATTCASHDSSMGVRLSGTWIFDPDSGAMASKADDAYGYFGWWLRKAGGTATPEVVPFSGATGLTATNGGLLAASTFAALGGKATYKGAAVGKYAMNRGADQYATGGHWTADATLTADFGDETARGSISGMIDGFMAGGESMDWTVTLRKVILSAGAPGEFDSSAATAADDGPVWSIGGMAAAGAGSWKGILYSEGKDGVPDAAVGTFSTAYGSVGHMAGAFGVHAE